MNFPSGVARSGERRLIRGAAARIGELAGAALRQELAAWPKPGLVSPVDTGSHRDMDAGTFRASAEALRPFFVALAEAGAANAGMDELRTIGRAAERAMLAATAGINTHRGAIFGLGLLCAAAGALPAAEGEGNDVNPCAPGSLGALVRRRWGNAILCGPVPRQSHGARVLRLHGAGGARAQAAGGFPAVYHVGLPALHAGRRLSGGDENAACVHACFTLIAALEDTNLLHRGGPAGLRFARRAAREFLDRGGVGRPGWEDRAEAVHRAFVARWLSPGGSADLLAMSLLVSALETPPPAAPPFPRFNSTTHPGNTFSCSPSF